MHRQLSKFFGWLKSSVVAIIGLSISITVSFLIFWLLSFETSFENMHEKREQVYRLSMLIETSESEDHYATTGALLGPELLAKYPFIEKYAAFGSLEGAGKIEYNEQFFEDEVIYQVNNEVFEIFSFEFLYGNASNALAEKNTIVITERLAEKLFGRAAVLDEAIKIDDKLYAIKGVIADIPNNSHLKFDVLIANALVVPKDEMLQSYFNLDHYTYVLLNKQNGAEDLERGLASFGTEYLTPLIHDAGAEFDTHFYGTRLDKLHFSEPLLMDTPKGNVNNLYILLGLAIILIVIGVSNYLNMTVVRSFKKSTKVGMLRVLGVHKLSIQFIFIRESMIIALISMLLSAFLTYSAITGLDALSDLRYAPGNAALFTFIGLFTLFMMLMAAIAGVIPVNQMYKGDIARLLKEKNKLISYNSWNQKVVLFVQVAISLALIGGTAELYRQFTFFQNKQLGFNHERVVVVQVPTTRDYDNEMETFKTGLLSNPSVKGVAFCRTVPGDELGQQLFVVHIGQEDKEVVHNFMEVDENYFEVLGIDFEDGRNFDRESDQYSLVVNQAFARKYGGNNAIGAKLTFGKEHKVVGLIADYHQLSFHNPIEPLVIGKLETETNQIEKVVVKTDVNNLNLLKAEWDKLGINKPFEYYFLEDHFRGQYAKEKRLLQVFMICSAIAVLLCGFGLYNLLAIMMKNRKRELAIRRVLGSTFLDNYSMLSKPFLIMLAISAVISVPAVYYTVLEWRNNYAYFLETSPFPYFLSLLTVALLVVATVFYHLKVSNKRSITQLIKED